jgi:LPLT family lysophospholipid transporter-like MFS transporter
MNKMPRGFFSLLMAQFVAAWADNALLIIAMAALAADQQPVWKVPLLKCLFTLSYVVLAPWVGVGADGWCKIRVMWLAHALKLAGVTLMLLGFDVLGSYAVAGIGAALYAPAKYGWMTQAVGAQRLVRANGYIETAAVLAAIGGVACGGWWVGPHAPGLGLGAWLVAMTGVDGPMQAAWGVMGLYWVAMVWTAWVPRLPGSYSTTVSWHRRSWQFFSHDWRVLARDVQARISLGMTTLFWGLGACMQLLVLAWAQQHLGLGLEQGAYLQGLAGLGVVLGAWWAGRTMRLGEHRPALYWGLTLGALLPLMAWVDDWRWALPLIIGIGVASGMVVVPMNAMLQHRGMQLLSPGRSVAVQNFNENLSVLTMLGLYAWLAHGQVALTTLLWLFDLVLVLPVLAWLVWGSRGATRPAPCTVDHPSAMSQPD